MPMEQNCALYLCIIHHAPDQTLSRKPLRSTHRNPAGVFTTAIGTESVSSLLLIVVGFSHHLHILHVTDASQGILLKRFLVPPLVIP